MEQKIKKLERIKAIIVVSILIAMVVAMGLLVYDIMHLDRGWIIK